jgi:hypothetical protein
MLSVVTKPIMLSVVMLSVVMLSAVAPRDKPRRQRGRKKSFYKIATSVQCYKTFFPLSLTMRPNKLEDLPLETLSSWVLEFEGKAKGNPIGGTFRCFLFW